MPLPVCRDCSLKPGRAEAITATKPTRRKHIVGDFYMVPAEWTERAAAALKTSTQLRMALRLYRRWRMRRGNEAVISASNAVLGGSRSWASGCGRGATPVPGEVQVTCTCGGTRTCTCGGTPALSLYVLYLSLIGLYRMAGC